MKHKIKSWLSQWLNEDYSPKKCRDLRAVAFESKVPVGNGKYRYYYFQCTEWVNGEGYDISIEFAYGKTNSETRMSISHDDIEGIMACLDYMGHFNS